MITVQVIGPPPARTAVAEAVYQALVGSRHIVQRGQPNRHPVAAPGTQVLITEHDGAPAGKPDGYHDGGVIA